MGGAEPGAQPHSQDLETDSDVDISNMTFLFTNFHLLVIVDRNEPKQNDNSLQDRRDDRQDD